MKVYVASSWRCAMQPAVIAILKSCKIDYYDFRNPPNKTGFGWEQVMPGFDVNNQEVVVADYIERLQHPLAVEGFESDFKAMKECTHCLLVLPCGKSAHLELGWFVGQSKPTAILLDQGSTKVQPELMYKMVDEVLTTINALFDWLGVE